MGLMRKWLKTQCGVICQIFSYRGGQFENNSVNKKILIDNGMIDRPVLESPPGCVEEAGGSDTAARDL